MFFSESLRILRVTHIVSHLPFRSSPQSPSMSHSPWVTPAASVMLPQVRSVDTVWLTPTAFRRRSVGYLGVQPAAAGGCWLATLSVVSSWLGSQAPTPSNQWRRRPRWWWRRPAPLAPSWQTLEGSRQIDRYINNMSISSLWLEGRILEKLSVEVMI